jgi:hypothetical protein
MAGLDAQDAQDGAVETLGGREVRDGDPDVIEHQPRLSVDFKTGRCLLRAFAEREPRAASREPSVGGNGRRR